MAVTLNADLELAGLTELVGAYATASSDLTPLMVMCGTLLETSTKDRIKDTNVSPDGVPWPPSFRATFDGGKTLHDTGRLGDSIQYVAGSENVEVGTNLIYAGVHQTGAVIEAKNGYALAFAFPGGGFAVVEDVSIPARPYLGISDVDREDLNAAAVAYFDVRVPS